MRNAPHVSPLAAAVALSCLLATGAAAQDFRLIDPAGVNRKAPHESPPFSHWDLREFPGCRVPWTLGTAAVPDLDGNGVANQANDRAVFIGVCQAGFDRWDAVTPNELGFTLVAGGGQPAGGFAQDGWNLMSWSATALTIGVNAATVVWRSAATGVITEADIVFNSDTAAIGGGVGVRTWVFRAHGASCAADFDFAPQGNWPDPADGDTDQDGDGNQELEVDIHTIATHEIGHLIGLHHIEPLGGSTNDPANALMEELWNLQIGPTGAGWANQTLKAQDEDGMNFLHSPDLGDAPDPWMGVFNQYPTLVHDVGAGRVLNGVQLDAPAKGAEHVLGIKPRQGGRNYTYEWLARFDGPGVTPECEANLVDRDPLDDGVTWYPNPPIWGRPLTVTAWLKYARDDDGNAHDYPARGLFANAWIDLNQNCVWEEWFLSAGFGPVPPAGPNAVATTTASATVLLPPAIDATRPVWLRARVDYGEHAGIVGNVDGTLAADMGAAQFGEVEDYPLYCRRPRYEVHRVCNPFPFPIPAITMITVGPPDPADQMFSAQVDLADCILGTDVVPPPVYHLTRDESEYRYPVPGWIPPFTYRRYVICRPVTGPPLTVLRPLFVDPSWPDDYSPPPEEVPAENRIPAVLVESKNTIVEAVIKMTVGAPDLGSGGWIAGPDLTTRQWSDSLRVSVSYRVSEGLLPLATISPCDPAYAALPLTTVGVAVVTPEDGFSFDVPIEPSGIQTVYVECETSWSTNAIVNSQIVAFEISEEPTPASPAPAHALTLSNYPNPFNPGTMIRFALPAAGPVTLAVYDVGGRLVRSLVGARRYPAGVHELEWDGRDDRGVEAPSGVYFLRIKAGAQTFTRKAVLLK